MLAILRRVRFPVEMRLFLHEIKLPRFLEIMLFTSFLVVVRQLFHQFRIFYLRSSSSLTHATTTTTTTQPCFPLSNLLVPGHL